MLADARRSPEAWNDFLGCFVDDEEVIARVKAKSPQKQSAGYHWCFALRDEGCPQAPHLLALAAIYDGGSQSDAVRDCAG